jgi:hypothetical protein
MDEWGKHFESLVTKQSPNAPKLPAVSSRPVVPVIPRPRWETLPEADLLKRLPLSTPDLAVAMHLDLTTLRARLYRLREQGVIRHDGSVWRIARKGPKA